MIATLSFLFSYGQWLLFGAVVVVGLGAIAFFLRNWKAAAIAAVLIAGTVYQGVVYKRGYDAANAKVRAEIERRLNERVKVLEDLRTADEHQRQADAARIAELRKKIDHTPVNKKPGLPKGAVGRIGEIK